MLPTQLGLGCFPIQMAQRWIKPKEYYWNFIQSLTQMCAELAFGLLKSH
jgi:hypothetical protein